MRYASVKTACIIGAGVAGLATARSLAGAGVECTVFEKNDRLGGVWTDGYMDFGVQVQNELYAFPEHPHAADSPQFTPGPMLQNYLEDFAARHGLTDVIRLSTTVEAVEPAKEGTGWNATVSQDGKRRTEPFDLVVVCVGLYSNQPYLPEIDGRDDFAGTVHHIGDLKDPEPVSGRKVAVVGYGKSASDAALIAARTGSPVDMIARRLHWPVPRKLAGILPFKWGLLNRLTLTMVPLYKSPSALERQVHSLGSPLVWLFWRVVELLLVIQCRLWSRFGTRQSLVPDEPAEIGAFSEATMVPHPDFYRLIRAGRINVHVDTIERFNSGGVVLASGKSLDADTVIFGTGWRSDYGFLSPDLQNRLGFSDDGVYLYRQMLHPDVPGLAFVGYASTVSNILAYAMQAKWLAGLVSGDHKLPDTDAQRAEIEKLKVWKRSWMPDSHARAARLIVHLPHYLDELCLDMGENPLRKTGLFAPLAEVFAPYEPRDYRALFEDSGKSVG